MKYFHPMMLLLKFEGYPPAVIASLILHGLLLFFILDKRVNPADFVTVEDPVIITASAIDVNPQRLRRIERLELERAAVARQREQAAAREREQQQVRERREREALAERQRQQQDAEAEQLRQQELARQRQANAEAERQRLAEQARADEARAQEQQRIAREQAAREAQSTQVAAENLIVAEYSARIRQIISQNWQRPPSARNGMTALLRVQLVPTGEVVGVTVLQSSGNTAYDRSVVQAVERAQRFPELQDLGTAVFERNFRSFNLLFKPEDLLR